MSSGSGFQNKGSNFPVGSNTRMKENARELLLAICQQYGAQTALNKAEQLMKQCEDKSFNRDARSSVKGEVSEAVSEILCAHIQKRLGNCIMSKGLCIPKKGGDSSRTTEMDIVLFTPVCIYMIECKSYSGRKVLKNECYIEAHSKKDVYRQNLLHMEFLSDYVAPYMLNDRGVMRQQPYYRLILFEMSSGSIIDTRTDHYKKLYPCLGPQTLLPWFNQELRQPKKVIYNMQGLQQMLVQLNANSSANFVKHVKRLGGKL